MPLYEYDRPGIPPHCDTCECADGSSLRKFNVRCSKLMKAAPLDVSMIDAGRLSASPKYRFGFREWMPSATNNYVVGMFLAAIPPGPQPTLEEFDKLCNGDPSLRDLGYRNAEVAWRENTRFFAVLVPHPQAGYPKPFEYNVGDAFDVSGAQVYGEDIESLMRWSDAALTNWLDRSRIALRDYVVAQLTAR